MKKPKKWPEVYPQGTKEGDEECKFFHSLARNKKYTYRSTAQIVKETGLSRERVEEIIEKYSTNFDPPLIYPHPTNADNWGYWERVPEVLKTDNRTISQKDQAGRIKKQITGMDAVDCSCGGGCGCSNGCNSNSTPVATGPTTQVQVSGNNGTPNQTSQTDVVSHGPTTQHDVSALKWNLKIYRSDIPGGKVAVYQGVFLV